MEKMNEAFLDGKEYTPKGKQITEYPDEFKEWVRDNADNIAKSRNRGTEPYFIRNNAAVIDGILKPKKRGKTIVKDTPAISITEEARQRHKKRTEQQERDIQRKWTLRRAKIRHRARTDEEIKAIKDKWEERNHLEFQEVVLRAGKYGIDYHQVHNLSKFLNDKEIIERIGGGDLTIKDTVQNFV